MISDHLSDTESSSINSVAALKIHSYNATDLEGKITNEKQWTLCDYSFLCYLLFVCCARISLVFSFYCFWQLQHAL